MIRRISVVLGILLVGFWHYEGDYWWSKWAVLLGLVAIDLAVRVARGTTWSAAAAWAYTIFSGLSVFAWRDNYVKGFDKLTATSMDATTAYTLVAFLILTLFLAGGKKALSDLREAFGWACLADSVVTLYGCFTGDLSRTSVGGFFDQYSMNGCFLALTFPFALELRGPTSHFRYGAPIIAMALVAVIGQTRSLFPILLVVLGVRVLLGYRGSWRFRLATFGVLALILGASLPLVMRMSAYPILSLRGRGEMYQAVLSWLFEKPWPYWFTGLGNGSFFIFGPGIQKLTHTELDTGWFLWLHSDWLQLVFEMGLVGLGLYLWLVVDCVRRAFRADDDALLGSFLGFCVCALFQYPVHLPLMALLGVFLVTACLTSKPAETVPLPQ